MRRVEGTAVALRTNAGRSGPVTTVRSRLMTASFSDVTFHGAGTFAGARDADSRPYEWLQQFVPAGLAVHALVDIPHRHRREYATRAAMSTAPRSRSLLGGSP